MMPSKHFPDGRIVPGTTWTVPPARHSYAIFRQARFVGFALANDAELAIELWLDTHDSEGVKPRTMPGPWEAIKEGEARERGLIR